MFDRIRELLESRERRLAREQENNRVSHFDRAIETVLRHEGGFVNDPVDPGGATNWGISLRYLKARGDLIGDGWDDGDLNKDGKVDIIDIKMMTREQAIWLYRTGFWDRHGYENITDYYVAEKAFDMGVNMGTVQAGRLVQRAANHFGKRLTVDGILGPMSIAAINSIEPRFLLREIRFNHINFYLTLIERRPELGRFRNGWLRRASE